MHTIYFLGKEGNMKMYHPPISSRLLKVGIRIFFLIFTPFLIYTYFKETASAVYCLTPIFFEIVFLSVFVGNMTPSISITEKGIRLHSIWGGKIALAWEDIAEVRYPRLPLFPRFYRKHNKTAILKTKKRLGILYKLYGYMYDTGGDLVFVDFRGKNGDLLALIKEKCPNAFNANK